MSKKNTLSKDKEKELIFCHQRLEQYWMLIDERIFYRKLTNKQGEYYKEVLCRWENIIFKMLGIT